MTATVTVLCLSLVVAISFSNAEPVSFIKKCKPGDSECIKQSAQAALPKFTEGIKEHGVKPADPLVIPQFDASTTGLKLTVSDAVITGLRGCKVEKFAHDTKKNQLLVKVLCDVNIEGNYDMAGQLLILPLEGKGPVHAKLRKLQMTVDLDLEDKVKDGKKYWHIKSFKHNYELKDKADVKFDNLFNGNEVLSRTARELIANNGNEIINEVGPPVIKNLLGGLVKNVNKFFSKVPLEDLIDYQ